MTTFKYKGFEVRRRESNAVEIRQDYSAAVHRGYPAPFTTIGNAVSDNEARERIDVYLVATPN